MSPLGGNRWTGHMLDEDALVEGNDSRRVTVAGQLALVVEQLAADTVAPLVVAVVAHGPREMHPGRETLAELDLLRFLAPGCCSRGCKGRSSQMNRNCCWSPKSYPNVSSWLAKAVQGQPVFAQEIQRLCNSD
jgi:hypothetical protein